MRHDLHDSEARRPGTGVAGTDLDFVTDIHVGTSYLVTSWAEMTQEEQYRAAGRERPML